MKENEFFKEVNGNFGFGCMRLPMIDKEVDLDAFKMMIDKYMEAGFNYFDTAHGYINGKSELALKECLTKRYDRNKYILTNKLTDNFFKTSEDIRIFFNNQLEWCGVDYFDFYLMHAQDHNNYQKFKELKAYEICLQLKKEGLIKHLGISFHDKAEVLEMILNEHPEIEVVQIQLNYIDYLSESIESKKVYEVCEKYHKPVIVMEPVKGGNLVNLPLEADKILKDLKGGSNASYALRFAASFKNITVVLSGMSNNEQMEDNISFMKDFKPLNEKELEAIDKVRKIFDKLNIIPCTACKYCIEENKCPKDIKIPELFSLLNTYETFNDWNAKFYYSTIIKNNNVGKPSDCIKCGLCEKVCPQHLPIRQLLVKVKDRFEKKEG